MIEMNAADYRGQFEEIQRAFSSPAGQALLKGLSTYCRARQTCVVRGDRDLSYVFEGRRQVFLYIQDHFDLTFEEFVSRYATIKDTGPQQER